MLKSFAAPSFFILFSIWPFPSPSHITARIASILVNNSRGLCLNRRLVSGSACNCTVPPLYGRYISNSTQSCDNMTLLMIHFVRIGKCVTKGSATRTRICADRHNFNSNWCTCSLCTQHLSVLTSISLILIIYTAYFNWEWALQLIKYPHINPITDIRICCHSWGRFLR